MAAVLVLLEDGGGFSWLGLLVAVLVLVTAYRLAWRWLLAVNRDGR